MDLILAKTAIEPSTDAGFTATVIIAGLGIVLATLLLLIIVFYIFGKIVSSTQGASMKKRKKNQMPITNAVVPAGAAIPAPGVASGVSGEVVAAISAAVYMMEGENAVVTSISPAAPTVRAQRKNPITRRNPWAFAAICDNTRPF